MLMVRQRLYTWFVELGFDEQPARKGQKPEAGRCTRNDHTSLHLARDDVRVVSTTLCHLSWNFQGQVAFVPMTRLPRSMGLTRSSFMGVRILNGM